LEAARSEAAKAEAAAKMAEARIAQLTEALQVAQSEAAKAEAAEKTAEARIAELTGALHAAQSAGEAREAAERAAAGEKDQLRRRLAELQAQLAEFTTQRRQSTHGLERASPELPAAQQYAAEVTASYRALLENAAQLKRVNAETLMKLAETRRELEGAQVEVARITGARGMYTVQGGDYLSRIAAFFYRNGHRWWDIFKYNAFLLSNPDLIFPGMVLIIPE
jgi:nucleoid-associated protein YgaU